MQLDQTPFRSLKKWLKQWFGAKGRTLRKRPYVRRHQARLDVEWLERRDVPSAMLATDKPDYAPGSSASIFGSGYLLGETVELRVVHLDNVYHNQYEPWQVSDGDSRPAYTDSAGILHMPDLDGMADGNIQTTWNVGTIPGSSLELTGTGLTSGQTATTTFTDDTLFDALSVGAQTGTVTYGDAGSATFDVAVDFSGDGSDEVTFSLTWVSGAPAGVTFDFSPASVTGTTTETLHSTLTISTTAATPAGAFDFTVTGDDGVVQHSSDGTFTVTKRAITVTAATNSKEYDGDTTAAALPTITAGTLAAGDSADFIETYDTKHVGTGKTLTPSGAVLDGNGGLNYDVTFVADTTGAITPRAITVTAVTNSKEYDGDTTAAATPDITAGTLAAGDSADFSETYDTKHVGTGKTLTPSGAVLDGNGGLNYDVTFVADTTGAITLRAITVTAATNSKEYDGSTSASATPTVTSGSLAPGDSAAFTETYDNENMGTGKTLTPSGSVIDGNGGANYDVTFVNNTTGAISKRPITVTALTNSKIFDGTTSAAAIPTITIGTLAAGDTANFIETYDTSNVGTGKHLTPSGSVSDGNSGANYNVSFAINTTGVITGGVIKSDATMSAATNAANGTGAFAHLTGPMYTESATGDVHVGTIILNAPAGFEFDTGGTAPNVLLTNVGGTSGSNINGLSDGATIPAVVTSSTITINITSVSTGTRIDSLKWQNVRIRPTNPSNVLANGELTTTGTSSLAGVTAATTSFGTMTETPAFIGNIGIAHAISPGSTLSVTVPEAGVAAGDTIIGSLVMNAEAVVSSITDSRGNAYTIDVDVPNSAASPNVETVIFSARAVTALKKNDTITVHFSTAPSRVAVSIDDFAGIALDRLDQTASATDSSDSPSSGDTAVTSEANELLFGAIGTNKSSSNLTVGTGYTPLTTVHVSGSTATIASEFQFVTATGAYHADGTLNSSAGWATGIATYKELLTTTTTVALTAGANPSTYGDALTFTATVTNTGSGATPAGEVQFFDGPIFLGVGTALSGGAVAASTFDISSLNAGTRTIRALFVGAAGVFYNSSGSVIQTVNKKAITVTAASNTKEYDGTTAASAIPTISAGTLVTGDMANFHEAYDNQFVGTGKTLAPYGSIADRNFGGNYNVTFVNASSGVINTPTTFPTARSVIRGLVYFDKNNNNVRDAKEKFLPGVKVILDGTSGAGSHVHVTAATNSKGEFTFLQVQPGTYSLLRRSQQYVHGKARVGNLGGMVQGSDITHISMAEGQLGVDYRLGEIGLSPDAVSLRNFLSSAKGTIPTLPPGRGTVAVDGTVQVPAVAGTASLAGAVLDSSTDAGIEGAEVALVGIDITGRDIFLTTKTGNDGKYLFANLQPGTYAVNVLRQPHGFHAESATVGSVGGMVLRNDQIINIPLVADASGAGSGYDFKEAPITPAPGPGPVIKAFLANDTPDTANAAATTSDGITSDPAVVGAISHTNRVTKLLARFGGGYRDITKQLKGNGEFYLNAAVVRAIAGGSLSQGAHTLHLKAIDSMGHVSPVVDVAFTLRSKAIAKPTLHMDTTSDPVPQKGRTSSATVTLEGKTSPSVDVALFKGGAAVATTTANGAGDFSFAGVGLDGGVNDFTVRASDVAGNESDFATFFVRENAPVAGPTAEKSVNKNKGTLEVNLTDPTLFSDADFYTSEVLLHTSAGPIRVRLLDNQAPQTVANFLNYIEQGRYDSTIFHRLVKNFVIQGGGFTFKVSFPDHLKKVKQNPKIANEFDNPSRPNTLGTIAMAKLGNDQNSASSEFFFNLGDNTSTLGPSQNGGFTVFGKIVGELDQRVVNTLASLKIQNKGGTFNEIPLKNYKGSHFPADTKAGNFALIHSVEVVRRPEKLTYTVISNSNESIVKAKIDANNWLKLTATDTATGSANVVVQAKDLSGNTTTVTIKVNVKEVSVTNPGNQLNLNGGSVNLPIKATSADKNDLKYSAVGLPPGLNINSATGVISGTVAGNANASSPFITTVTATDATNPALQDSQTFLWTVKSA